MGTTIVIKNQIPLDHKENSLNKPLLTLSLKDSTKGILSGSTIMDLLEEHVTQCDISPSIEPDEQLELIFTKKITVSKSFFLDLRDLYINGAFYTELEELLRNSCGTDPKKQKEILQNYINRL